jgi:hypothetical protein
VDVKALFGCESFSRLMDGLASQTSVSIPSSHAPVLSEMLQLSRQLHDLPLLSGTPLSINPSSTSSLPLSTPTTTSNGNGERKNVAPRSPVTVPSTSATPPPLVETKSIVAAPAKATTVPSVNSVSVTPVTTPVSGKTAATVGSAANTRAATTGTNSEAARVAAARQRREAALAGKTTTQSASTTTTTSTKPSPTQTVTSAPTVIPSVVKASVAAPLATSPAVPTTVIAPSVATKPIDTNTPVKQQTTDVKLASTSTSVPSASIQPSSTTTSVITPQTTVAAVVPSESMPTNGSSSTSAGSRAAKRRQRAKVDESKRKQATDVTPEELAAIAAAKKQKEKEEKRAAALAIKAAAAAAAAVAAVTTIVAKAASPPSPQPVVTAPTVTPIPAASTTSVVPVKVAAAPAKVSPVATVPTKTSPPVTTKTDTVTPPIVTLPPTAITSPTAINGNANSNDNNDDDDDASSSGNVSKSARRRARKKGIPAAVLTAPSVAATTIASSPSSKSVLPVPMVIAGPSAAAWASPKDGIMAPIIVSRPSSAVTPSFDQTLRKFQRDNLGRQEGSTLPVISFHSHSLAPVCCGGTDAQEFMSFLLDELHEELLHLAGPNGSQVDRMNDDNNDDDWSEMGKKNRKRVVAANIEFRSSVVSRMFGGRLRSMLLRHERNLSDSISYQPFFTLPLDIASPSCTSLQAAFTQFMTAETLEGLTRRSGSGVRASQQITLSSPLPECLIVHLKRFTIDWEYTGRAVKIEKHIGFTSSLTLPGHYMHGSAATPTSSSSGVTYQLRSIVVHHGAQIAGGHYTSYVRSSSSSAPTNTPPMANAPTNEEIWYHYDDSTVRRVPTADVYRQQAYLLVFAKQ